MRFLNISAFLAFLLLSACATPPVKDEAQQPKDLQDLTSKIDNHAGLLARDEIRADLIEESVRIFFELHASELMIRHYYEQHSSAYVRWVRYKEYLLLNETDEVTVAGWLAKVEATRMELHKEQANYRLMRHRLTELTGESFLDEMVQPPLPPAGELPELSFTALAKAVNDADVLEYKDPTMPGVKTIEHEVLDTINSINLAWQGIVTAKAALNFSRKNLSKEQQLYSLEQSVSLGAAMTEETKSEAMLVRATGQYYAAAVRLAIYLDRDPADALKPDFLARLAAEGYADSGEQFTPKEGSGFGQEDQDELPQ